MSSVIGTDGTIEFTYYNQRSQKETIRLRQDTSGELLRVNDDGAEEFMYKYEGVGIFTTPLPSENYNDIISKMKNSANSTIGWNTVFNESFDLMKGYYAGNKSCEDVKSYIRNLCKCNGNNEVAKAQACKTLSLVYEYMSRANSRNAVNQNMSEAERMIVDTGIRKDAGNQFSNLKGFVYYNADYYYSYKDMQDLFKETISELASEYGIDEPVYEALDKSNRFPDGGTTYNGVWNHETYNENVLHYLNEYKFFDENYVPEEDFLFCESELRYDDATDLKRMATEIKRYVTEKIRKTSQKGKNFLVELSKHNMQDLSDVKKSRNLIRKYFGDNDINYQNVRDRRWTGDYFGLILY